MVQRRRLNESSARVARRPLRKLGCAGALASAIWLGVAGCANQEKPPKRATQPVVDRGPVAEPLRGTIGSMVTFGRIQPVLVSGFGVVVGLRGTGGGPYRADVAQTVVRYLSSLGVGTQEFDNTPIAGMSPAEILQSKDVEVVVVQAAIPPGSPKGARFDVRVQTMRQSGCTSLEGGYLWLTELRVGPPSPFTSRQARLIGNAEGAVFINPFAQGGKESDAVVRTVGRVLDGGLVTNPEDVIIRLDNPSHQMAREIVQAIQTRFPDGPGLLPTARGRSDQQIWLNVPDEYIDQTGEFLEVVRCLHPEAIRYPQEFAKKYAEALQREPYLASELSFCLVATGEPAMPYIRPLYSSAEVVVRMAALRAGARLGDVQAAPDLRELAASGPGLVRVEAMELLADLDAGPMIDSTLRQLLASPEKDVRVAAYESLARRAERVQFARLMASIGARARDIDPEARRALMQVRSRINLPGDTMQGVRRRSISEKFLLDEVEGGEPMIYVSQTGRPRITLFGGPRVLRPMLVTAWDNRLMIQSQGESVQVYYLAPGAAQAIQGIVRANLPELIQFLAHRPTPESPEPGLDLSYSEVVGVLSLMQEQRGVDAAFAAQRDALTSDLLRAARLTFVSDRPETTTQTDTDPLMDGPLGVQTPTATEPAEPESILVPLRPRPTPP